MNATSNEALRLAADGWPVLRCVPRAKNPLTRHGYKDATTDAEQISRWWTERPNANLAIAVPPGYMVLDEDSRGALDLLKGHDRTLPDTVMASTPRGFHYWFTLPAGVVVRNRTKVFPGIDLRTAGGHVVVEPSLRTRGRSYRWVTSLVRERIAPAPPWLVEAVCSAAGPQNAGICPSGGTVYSDEGEIVLKGGRNDAICRLTGSLLGRRIPIGEAFLTVRSFNATRCYPRLSDAELERTFLSITDRELNKRGCNQ